MVDPLPLVRDVLDKQIYDANNEKVGKVDGIVLQLRKDRAPRVLALESDMPTAWRRVSRRVGDAIERFQRWVDPGLAAPTRIRVEHLLRAGIDVQVDIDATKTTAFVWDTWLCEHIVGKLPGGRSGGSKEE